MENRWLESELNEYIKLYGKDWGRDLAERTYSSRLIGAEPNLVLHGGGNTSVKGAYTDILGETHPAIYVKASGRNMAHLEPQDHPGIDLDQLRRLRTLHEMADSAMVNEIRRHLIDAQSPTPSIETFMHAFIPKKFIDHTHADAILILTNQPNGKELVREALGDNIIVLDYIKAGFLLAKYAADAFDANPNAKCMVLMHHGIVTWGDTAKESYDAMIENATLAEKYILAHASNPIKVTVAVSMEEAEKRLSTIAPIVRGVMTPKSENPDKVFDRITMVAFTDEETLEFIDSDNAREMILTPPLTADHLIRTKPIPMWVQRPIFTDLDDVRSRLVEARDRYIEEYNAYIKRHMGLMPDGVSPFDPYPRIIVVQGAGVFCTGHDIESATITRDIARHTLKAKRMITKMGGSYKSISEDDIFDMEYYTLQHAKINKPYIKPLEGETAIVTGAAGAIGSGICRGLLENGCNVAITDLPGDNLDSLVAELKAEFGDHVAGVPIDVTNVDSVSEGIKKTSRIWGGVDIAVINAGIAYVANIKEMELGMFQKLERINVEGALITMKEMAKHFELQGTGGDMVLISTKNVFAPGSAFGAYSATKAAAHQLGRIASMELAPLGVRVNMVAPDAVFSSGSRKSGLWQEVGPSRMRSRGLDEKGLEEYYQSRNLLKARVTAEHVANAVVFFVTRQTPTTGATIPVDGGLPDATPR